MLRPYQQHAVDSCLNHIGFNSSHGVCVMPTGSGKSHVIAAISEKLAPHGRVLILSHRKELLAQNKAKFTQPDDIAIISAGLGEKTFNKQITIGGIQTVYNCADRLENIKYILIDEGHLLNNTKQTSRYWETINFLKPTNLLGFTATPFRLEGGRNKPLTWGKICYNLDYKYLIDNKFLCPLKNKVNITIDTSKVEIKNGEFVLDQLEDAAIDKGAIKASVEKILQYAENFNRKSILVFCSGIKHVEILAFALAAHRFRVEKLTSKTPKEKRKILLEKFKTGEVRCILNCEVLTTGFDAPNIDMIAVLRPTKSKALHEQILGRGVRTAENKTECIILDMAGNLEEHGGLGSPLIDNLKISSSEQVKKDYKICPACEEQIKANERNCPECGFYFEPQQREVTHNLEPDTNTDILGKKPVKVYEVDFCEFKEHISKEKKKSLKISYYCGYNLFNEWIVPFHENEWASNKGLQIANDFGLTGLDYKELAESAKLGYKKPVKILVEPDGKYDRIVNRIWEQKTEDLDDCIPF